MKEIWKPIKDYEGLYEISNFGRVKSLYTNKILRDANNGKDYRYVHLVKDKLHRNYTIHRLVANHFLENPFNLKEVNHIDGNKRNNAVTNLEWSSHSYNQLHRYHVLNKGNKCNKKVICVETNKVYKSITEVSKEFDKSVTAISNALNNKSKTFAGLHWVIIQ